MPVKERKRKFGLLATLLDSLNVGSTQINVLRHEWVIILTWLDIKGYDVVKRKRD